LVLSKPVDVRRQIRTEHSQHLVRELLALCFQEVNRLRHATLVLNLRSRSNPLHSSANIANRLGALRLIVKLGKWSAPYGTQGSCQMSHRCGSASRKAGAAYRSDGRGGKTPPILAGTTTANCVTRASATIVNSFRTRRTSIRSVGVSDTHSMPKTPMERTSGSAAHASNGLLRRLA